MASSSNDQPRFLMPKFDEKPRWKRGGNNGFEPNSWSTGVRWSNDQQHFGVLDSIADVVVVNDRSSMVFFERRGWCFGHLFPVPFQRRIKGEMRVSEEPVPSASEFVAICVEAERKSKREAEEAKSRLQRDGFGDSESRPLEKRTLDSAEQPVCLKLSLLEALYLSYDLRRLTILMNSNNKDAAFTPDDFFEYCCGTMGNLEFLTKYVAYRYYRRKDWIVRNGESFGVTFVLYKSHPAEFHSTYGVLVVSPSLPKACNWRKMTGLCRELNVVSKGLLICTVSSQVENSSGDLSESISLADLDGFGVTEMLVKPWFAKRQFDKPNSSKSAGESSSKNEASESRG